MSFFIIFIWFFILFIYHFLYELHFSSFDSTVSTPPPPLPTSINIVPLTMAGSFRTAAICFSWLVYCSCMKHAKEDGGRKRLPAKLAAVQNISRHLELVWYDI